MRWDTISRRQGRGHDEGLLRDLAAIECSLVGLALLYRVAVAMYVIKPNHDQGGPQPPQRARSSSTVYICSTANQPPPSCRT